VLAHGGLMHAKPAPVVAAQAWVGAGFAPLTPYCRPMRVRELTMIAPPN